MRVVLGGTFDPLHAGHRRLLERALELAGTDGSVHIGLVTDLYSRRKRERDITPYAQREASLQAWFEERLAAGRLTVRPLEDPHGPSATGDYDVIVVSPETAKTAADVNRARREQGLPLLEIVVVPYALGADLLPVSGTRIRAGRIDSEGKRLQPLVVAVGSLNPVKAEATRRAFARFLGDAVIRVQPVSVESGVPAQPRGPQGHLGARNRAVAALEAARSQGAEYGVGIEAALQTDPLDGSTLDVQHCVIVDATGFYTHGHGAGFAYPPAAAQELSASDASVTDVIGPAAGDPEIGRKKGAVGWLTRGVLDRTRLTEHAVEAALVPRARRELYEGAAQRAERAPSAER